MGQCLANTGIVPKYGWYRFATPSGVPWPYIGLGMRVFGLPACLPARRCLAFSFLRFPWPLGLGDRGDLVASSGGLVGKSVGRKLGVLGQWETKEVSGGEVR